MTTPGILRIEGVKYKLTADGWVGGELSSLLDRAFPVGSSEVGDPVCVAFTDAVRAFGPRAEVVRRPVAGPYPPDELDGDDLDDGSDDDDGDKGEGEEPSGGGPSIPPLTNRIRVKYEWAVSRLVTKAAAVLDSRQDAAETDWHAALTGVFARLGSRAAQSLRGHLAHGHRVHPAEASHAAIDRTDWERELGAVLEPVLHAAALGGAAAEWQLFRSASGRGGSKAAGDSLPRRVMDVARAVTRSVLKDGLIRAIVDGVIGAVRKAVRRGQKAGLTGTTLADVVANDILVGAAPGKAATRVTRTEAAAVVNAGQAAVRADLVKAGAVVVTEWVTRDDERVRPDHRKANGQRVRPGQPFVVGGERCYYPGDKQLSLDQRAGCRCKAVTVYVPHGRHA